MTAPTPSEVVIIGGGMSGLAAAWELTGGAGGPTATSPRVTILDAGERMGGKVAPTTVGDRKVDAGPDGVLARRREFADLVGELGASDQILPIAASGASVLARGRIRPLPSDLSLGIPTSWSSLRRSHLLSPRGLLRALRDVVAPRPASRGHLPDRAIGGLVERKLGPEVVATLVDPMIGGISAGRVAEMSAAAVFPALLEAAQQRGGLMAALAASTAPPIPGPPADTSSAPAPAAPPAAFISLAGGMHSVVDLLVDALEARGVTMITGRSISSLRRQTGGGWWVESNDATTPADAVIIAAPTSVAAELLEPHDHDAASLLRQTEYASVAVLTFEFTVGDLVLPEHGTGILVPPVTPVPSGPRVAQRFLTTALTFLDRKWPHLGSDGTVLLRVSVGRIDDTRPTQLDDEALEHTVLDELATLVEVLGPPTASSITRWEQSLPQYKVNHLLRVAGIDAALERFDGLEVCGAAYGGVGVPACVASGRMAARRLLGTATRA